MPTLKSLLIHTWEKGKHFLIKAGTYILAVSVSVWFLLNLPWGRTVRVFRLRVQRECGASRRKEPHPRRGRQVSLSAAYLHAAGGDGDDDSIATTRIALEF